MADLTGPRKARNTIENIEDEKRRAVVSIIDPYIKKSGYTKKFFAEVYPKVSLSTLNNLYKPKYDRKISPRILKQLALKISYMFGEVSAEELYSDLLEAAQLDIAKHPFEKVESDKDVLSKTDMLFNLAEVISNLPISGKILRRQSVQYLITKDVIAMPSGPFELLVDYTEEDSPLDCWAVDTSIGGYDLKQFFSKMLLDGCNKYPNDKVKYSILTDSLFIYRALSNLEIPVLNVYFTIIYYDGDKFTETYISTGKNPDILKEKGLSL